MSTGTVVLLAACLSLTACADKGAANGAHARGDRIIDSAGVIHVDYDLRVVLPSATILELAPEPLVRIAGDSDSILDGVDAITGGAMLANNNIALGLRSGQEIVVFDQRGSLVLRIGRRGSGPGEFRRLMGPWTTANGELVSYDTRLRRMTVFDTGGLLLMSATYMSRSASDTSMILSSAVGALQDGRIVARLILPAARVAGSVRDSLQLALLDSNGAILPVGARFAGDETFVSEPNAAGFAMISTSPFGRRAVTAACPNSMLAADNSTFVIRDYNREGKLARVLDGNMTGEAIERRHFVAEITREAGSLSAATDVVVDMLEKITPHATLPAIRSIMCSADGYLWVQLFGVPDATEIRVVVFDSTLALVGTMAMPVDHVLLDARSDRVLIARPGPDEVAVVELRALRER